MQGVAKRDHCKRSDLVINGLQPIERLTMNILPYYSFITNNKVPTATIKVTQYRTRQKKKKKYLNKKISIKEVTIIN